MVGHFLCELLSFTTICIFCKFADEFDQGADGDAGGAFGDPGFGVFHPGDTGDVEVNPGRVTDELFKEHGGGDGAAPASATVDDVGDVGLDHLAIVVFDGQ